MTESFNRKLGRLAQNVSGTGSITTNAATASAWQTARTITLAGDLSGSVSIDGSSNVSLTATVSGDSIVLGTDTTGNYVATVAAGSGITVTGSGTETAAVTVSIDNTVATLTGEQTLTNKTINVAPATGNVFQIQGNNISSYVGSGANVVLSSSPTITNLYIPGTGMYFNGSTSGITNLQATAEAGSTSLTLPAATDTLVGRNTTDTLTNKTISGSNNTISNIGNGSLTNSSITINGTSVSLGGTRTLVTDDVAEDGSPVNLWFTNARARGAISVSDTGGDGSLSYDSGTGVITYTGPSATEVRAHLSAGTGLTYTTGQFAIDSTVVTLTGTQTLTNKTLTSPVISSISNTGTLTLPTTTDTLVGRATTDTLTNKTISGNDNTITNIGNASLSNSSITINGTSVSLGGTRTLVTDDISEDGSPVNLWYTDTRARSAISVTDAGGDGSLTYSSGVITYTGPSATEVRAHLSAGTGLTYSSGQFAIDSTVATLTGSQTLSNKTLTTPIIAEIDSAADITLDATGDIILDADGADVLLKDGGTTFGAFSQTGGELVIKSGATPTAAITMAGADVTIAGNLTVSGTTTTVNSNTVTIGDNILVLNSDEAGTPSQNAGIEVERGTSTNATLLWNESTDSWMAGVAGSEVDLVTTSGTQTLTNKTINGSQLVAGSVANAALTNSTISGKALGTNLDTLTMAVSGTGLSGSQTYNGSAAATFTVTSNATNANTGSTIVARDASGNFSAGTITANLSGNASTVTNGVYTTDTGTVTNTMLAGSIANNKLANSTISGISLGGNLATLTIGTGLSGTSYNGSTAVTIANTGVISITGTANQVTASASTGDVTLSLPQNIHTGATPTFAGVVVGSGQGIYYDNTNYLIRPYDTSIASGTLIYSAANSTIVADFDGTGTGEFFQVRAGAGTPNVLKLLSKTSGAGVNNSALTLNDNVIWNAANDGEGSGLDADLLDGNHASAFALASHTHAISEVTSLQTTLDGKAATNQTMHIGTTATAINRASAAQGLRGVEAYYNVDIFDAPGSAGTYVWVRASMGGFNAGGDTVRFSVQRSINDNNNSPYGGPSAEFTVHSREWHGGQECQLVYYSEHGAGSGTGGQYISHAGARDLAGGGYWFYMRLEGGIRYRIYRHTSSGFIGTFESASDPGSVPTIPGWGFSVTGNAPTIYSGTNTVLHAGNYNSYALPLSGGTLSGNLSFGGQTGTWIQSSAMNDSIGWNGTYGVYIGSNVSGTNYMYGNGVFYDGTAHRTLLHSANYSSYALPLSGGTVTGTTAFTRTDDNAISVGTIRGRAVGGQSGEYIQLYERVNIGSPAGWGSRGAPSYGLSTYGGADLATDTGSVRITTGSIAVGDAGTRGLILDGNYTNGQFRHRWRKQDDGNGIPLYLDYAHATANSFTAIARFGGGGTYRELDVYGTFSATTVLQGSNQVLHAGNYSSYSLPLSGGTLSSRLNIHQSGSGGGQNLFTGLELPTGANGRAQLVLSSAYSDLVIASSQANDNHGSTLTFATYNPSDATDYRKFVINQGNWGNRRGFLDFGYDNTNPRTNPHDNIYSDDVMLTLDGVNKRVGVNQMNPSAALDITGNINMTGVINTTAPGGSILMRHSVAEVDAWIFMENAPNWGLYWKNAPTGQHTFGGYTSVGAELFGMSAVNASGNGVATTNYVGATSAVAQWMLSNYTGYIWSASTVFAAGDIRTTIFYDSNNTAFYCDPNGTSRLGGIQITQADTGTTGNGIFFYGVAGDNPASYDHTAIVERLWGTDDQSELILFKGNDLDTSTIHDRIRIATTGRIVFHSTATYQTYPAYISAAGTGNIAGSGYIYGNDLVMTGNVTAYSDIRLKTDITNITDALEKVLKIRGVTYNRTDVIDTKKRYAGVIAQEVEQVLPEVVSEDDEGMKNVAYGNMIGLLIEAIKEQQQEIEALKKHIKNSQ